MNSDGISTNKAFRLLVGCFCIFLGWKLWSTNWFSQFFSDESEGFSDPAMITMLIGCVISAVELCGIVAIGLVTNILTPLIEPLFDNASRLVVKAKESFPASPSAPAPAVDASKLVETLKGITERLDALDGKGDSDG